MRILIVAAALAAMAGPALAQNSGAGAIGAATANSSSGSFSGAANTNVFTSPANTTTNSRVSGTTTQRNVPTAIAPGLAAAGIETCLGSVSAGASGVGFGFSFATTVKDDGCNRRLFARQMWNMGDRNAARAIQCLDDEVRWAMAATGTPGCPPPPNSQQVAYAPGPAIPVARPFAPSPVAAPGNGLNPPPGYAVNPDFVKWQQEESTRMARHGRRGSRRAAYANLDTSEQYVQRERHAGVPATVEWDARLTGNPH